MNVESPQALGFGVVALIVLGVWLGVRISRWRVSRRGRAVSRRGARGERIAVRLLEKHGYRVVEEQARRHAEVEVDGKPRRFEIIVDAIATRGRVRYVAEFKTGGAASIGNRGTRRQLLEYAVAFPDHGLILVDATSRTLCEIDFPGLR